MSALPFLHVPSGSAVRRIVDEAARGPLTYGEPGLTHLGAAPGYVIDENRVRLGSGAAVFERAADSLRRWRMFDLGWVGVLDPGAPIEVGVVVGVRARALGLWWVNPCRIVEVIADDGAVARFGFAYGTLRGHAESGEEQFVVEWHRDDDSVWYALRALSRPGRLLTWLGYPLVRRLQRRFARDSMRAMRRAAQC